MAGQRGDPARLRPLEFLPGAEHTVPDARRASACPRTGVPAHLACLADCGYVPSRHAGRFAYYTVADPSSRPDDARPFAGRLCLHPPATA
jgi:hypothetical protein